MASVWQSKKGSLVALTFHNRGKFELNYSLAKLPLHSGYYGDLFSAVHKVTAQTRLVKRVNKKTLRAIDQDALKEQIAVLENVSLESHPNIGGLIEYFETVREVFIVTDLYQGGDLLDAISDQLEFPEDQAALVLRQVLSCLAFLHSEKRSTVHRDIKPESILLQKKIPNRGPDYGSIKLVGFSRASRFKKNQIFEERVGTPFYMAPEVINRSYNHQCDIWSVGVLAYVLLSGYPPFYGESVPEIFAAILKGEIIFEFSDSNVWDNVSNTAKEFVVMCLTRDYAKRPSAETLLKHSFITNIRDITTEPVNVRGTFEMKSSKTVDNLRNLKRVTKLTSLVYGYIIQKFLTPDKRDELAKVFVEWDTNNDGTLSREELIQGLEKHDGLFASTLDADQMFEMIDLDGSGTIDYHEFLLAATDIDVLKNKKHLKAVFRLFDEDGDGFVTAAELKKMIGGGNDVDAKSLAQMIQEVDTDGDGNISEEEFMAMFHQ